MKAPSAKTPGMDMHQWLLPLLTLVVLCSGLTPGKTNEAWEHKQTWHPMSLNHTTTWGTSPCNVTMTGAVLQSMPSDSYDPIIITVPIFYNVYIGNDAAHMFYGNIVKCTVCELRVQKNHRQVVCDECENVFYMNCVNMSLKMYKLHKQSLILDILQSLILVRKSGMSLIVLE